MINYVNINAKIMSKLDLERFVQVKSRIHQNCKEFFHIFGPHLSTHLCFCVYVATRLSSVRRNFFISVATRKALLQCADTEIDYDLQIKVTPIHSTKFLIGQFLNSLFLTKR